MTLRDKTAISDLLHARWSDKTGYAYIRLNGEGSEADRRILQPVDVMDHTADGLWLPRLPQSDEGPDELRVYPTGLGEMRDIVLDHPGGVGSTIYRIGVKSRSYKARDGSKKTAWELRITDRIDLSQTSLPPTTTSGPTAPGAPPPGGVPTGSSRDALAAGPISPPPAAAASLSPLAAPAGETGLCACGRDAVVMSVQQGPRAGKSVCLTCGKVVA